LLRGLGKKGILLALELKDRPGKLYEIIDAACDYGGRASSLVATYERAKTGSRRLYIRIDDIDKLSFQRLKEVIGEKAKLLSALDTHEETREIF
jgi:ACT domain-containing protein